MRESTRRLAMDYLKKQVVDAVLTRVRQVEGDGIYDIYE